MKINAIIRVYDMCGGLVHISDGYTDLWSLDDLKRIAERHMDSKGGAYYSIAMVDGTTFRSWK